jgi:hypothetical protein
VDSVLMPGSSFGTAPDVCIHHHRQKMKGERSKASRIWPLLYHPAIRLSTENGHREGLDWIE